MDKMWLSFLKDRDGDADRGPKAFLLNVFLGQEQTVDHMTLLMLLGRRY